MQKIDHSKLSKAPKPPHPSEPPAPPARSHSASTGAFSPVSRSASTSQSRSSYIAKSDTQPYPPNRFQQKGQLSASPTSLSSSVGKIPVDSLLDKQTSGMAARPLKKAHTGRIPPSSRANANRTLPTPPDANSKNRSISSVAPHSLKDIKNTQRLGKLGFSNTTNTTNSDPIPELKASKQEKNEGKKSKSVPLEKDEQEHDGKDTKRPISTSISLNAIASNSNSEATSPDGSMEVSTVVNVQTQPPKEELPFKPKNHRDRVALEILTTERSYVKSLQLVIESFLHPLKEQFQRDPNGTHITQENLNAIFSNLEDILAVNVILLESLEKRMQEWATNEQLGDIFESLTPFLKMYTLYTAAYDTAVHTLNECEKNMNFANYVKKWDFDEKKESNLNLRAFLIMPVQRIPRYKLLLEDLFKHTPEDHPDYPKLSAATSVMKRVANDINENIRNAENRRKIIEIQNSFMSEVSLVAPHRVFLKDGPLMKICRKTRKQRWFFLFNDVLIYATLSPFSQTVANRYIFHLELPLASLRLKDIPDKVNPKGESTLNAFQIISAKKTFIVLAKSHQEKTEWMLAIQEAVNKLNEKTQTLKKEDNQPQFEAPLWVPDKESDQCTLCMDYFTFVNRRHHCRACGRLVCGDCSSRKIILPHAGNKPVRVCTNCYQFYEAVPELPNAPPTHPNPQSKSPDSSPRTSQRPSHLSVHLNTSVSDGSCDHPHTEKRTSIMGLLSQHTKKVITLTENNDME